MSWKTYQSVTTTEGITYRVGDVIHIKRYYYEEGSKLNWHQRMFNSVMVDVKVPITKITKEPMPTGYALWCGQFSTSTTDIANKGIVN